MPWKISTFPKHTPVLGKHYKINKLTSKCTRSVAGMSHRCKKLDITLLSMSKFHH